MDMSLSELRELVMDREACVLWFMGSQRVEHDWATELNWTEGWGVSIFSKKIGLANDIILNLLSFQK